MPLPFRPCLVAVLLAAACGVPVAVQAAPPAGAGSLLFPLLPTNLSGTSLQRPGELRENRLHGERLLPLTAGLQWQTSTDLRGVRHEEIYPWRSQSISLSTGPTIKLGQTEFAMPVLSSHEADGLGGNHWRTASPQLSVTLGPNDRIRLEARISRNASGPRRSRQSASVSWKHKINERWALSTGLSHSRTASDAELRDTAEAYAGLDASRPGGLSWSLTSRISGSSYGMPQGTAMPTRGQTTSLLLSTRYPLHGGWWLGSELRTSQTLNGGGVQPASTQSAGLRLFRNF